MLSSVPDAYEDGAVVVHKLQFPAKGVAEIQTLVLFAGFQEAQQLHDLINRNFKDLKRELEVGNRDPVQAEINQFIDFDSPFAFDTASCKAHVHCNFVTGFHCNAEIVDLNIQGSA